MSELTPREPNLVAFMRERGFGSYESLWRWSVGERAEFWAAVVERLGIRFRQPSRVTLDRSAGVEHARWFPGAFLNIIDSCFQHDPETLAVIHRRDGLLHRVTRRELEAMVDGAARWFRAGERVAIIMPMTLDAVVAYLGIIKAGGTVVSIADSFSAPEIATRLRIGQAQTVLTQDVVRRAGRTHVLARRIREAGSQNTIVVRTTPEFALDPDERAWELETSGDPFDAVAGPSHGDTNILFSSGTTGEPKAVPWSQLTPIKAAMDGHFHQDLGPGDVACWPTSLGWMMGPWLIYASLINGAALALFDDAPNTRAFGEFVRDAGVTMLGVVPSLVSAWRTLACLDGIDWREIRLFSSTGEPSNEADMRWLMERSGGKPVIEYCGGTEIGGGYITSTILDPAPPGTFNTPTLGLDFVILDAQGEPADSGELFLVPPSVGLSAELRNADHHAIYYEDVPRAGLRRHGDQFERGADGLYRALGRADDTMNLGGIKVSSAEIERAIAGVPGIREAAAVARGRDGPDRLVLFVVPESGTSTDPADLRAALQRAIRDRLNPLFHIARVELIDALPRTASNKVMRRELRARLKS